MHFLQQHSQDRHKQAASQQEPPQFPQVELETELQSELDEAV
jgi:hypothetical protein